MLLCVILVWPTKFENSLSFMQNMFAIWEFKDKWLKTLFLRNLGSKQVFWKAFHLILMHFIHKILCFEEFLHKIALFFKKKNCVFQIFDRLKLFLDWSKMWLKFWFESDRFNRCLISFGSIEGIFNRLNLIFDQLKIV